MDGNRRWAKEQNLPAFEGHRAGYRKFKEAITWAQEAGVSNLIFYAFSTENWKRDEKEVAFLLSLITTGFENDLKELVERNIRLQFIGQRDRFPKNIQEVLRNSEQESAENTGCRVAVALSYGGRAEILHAVNSFIEEGRTTPVTEEEFSARLWTTNIPDPDLIIRTGEAMRLSNFLPWQSVYSELYFTSTYWPDFDKEEFDYILEEYANRERRMGR